MNDSYGSVLREKLKESMEVPFVPLNRRFKEPPKLSWWERNNEFVGFVAWSVVVAAIGTELFLVYGLWPR